LAKILTVFSIIYYPVLLSPKIASAGTSSSILYVLPSEPTILVTALPRKSGPPLVYILYPESVFTIIEAFFLADVKAIIFSWMSSRDFLWLTNS